MVELKVADKGRLRDLKQPYIFLVLVLPTEFKLASTI